MMMQDSKLSDEAARLAALRRYEVLDTGDEASFNRITALVKTILNVPICTISLVDADRQWFKSCIGLEERETERGVSFCTHTIQQRDPMHVRDALDDPRFAENPLVLGEPHIRSYLGVPLSTPDGYNVGSLCVIDRVPRDYTAQQIDVLKSFAALVVDELELRRIAQTDHLTGAVSRRGFLLELEKAMAAFKRSKTSSALIMMDIDHFKHINDTYGHPVGDEVLKTVASQLVHQLRLGDTLGRLGGEEFGILLENVEAGNALRLTERLRMVLEKTPIAHETPLFVTASFGVAMLSPDIDTPEAWVEAADQPLYESKRSGRNRSTLATLALAGEVPH